MTPYLIDTHCHLHFPAYSDAQRDAALLRMKEKNIWAITVGTSAKTSADAIRYAEGHENVFATVGYHPEHLTSSFHDESEGPVDTFDIAKIEELAASSNRVVGIGETGLDFFRIDKNRDIEEAHQTQETAFRQHIDLAIRLGKPLVIHCREALTRLAEIIADVRRATPDSRPSGVVHCYTGTWTEAQPLLDLGLFLGFTGIITFPPRRAISSRPRVGTSDLIPTPRRDSRLPLHDVIQRMPLNRILVETDAPWLAPIPHRGEQNEPTYVEYVAQKIADLRGISVEEVARTTTENAKKLFQL